MAGIHNVRVDAHSLDSMGFSVHWEDAATGGLRYHIWYKDGVIRDNRLYKNPPHGVKHGEPGDFRARYLDPTNTANAKTIKAVLCIVVDGKMFHKAEEAVKQERADELTRIAQQNREAVIRGEALGTYGALRKLIEAVAVDDYPETQKALVEARAALAAANPDDCGMINQTLQGEVEYRCNLCGKRTTGAMSDAVPVCFRKDTPHE